MEEMVPVSQARTVGGWQRVGLPCLFLANAVLSLWADGFRRFEWLPWACIGLAWLTLSARKNGAVPGISEEAAKPRHVRTAHRRNSGIWT